MRAGWVILVGVVVIIAAFAPFYADSFAVADRSVPASSELTYQVESAIGPVAVNVTWQVENGSPQVHVGYCPPDTGTPGAGCANSSSFEHVYYKPSGSGGSFGPVPAGSLVFAVVTGPPGAEARVHIHVGSPTLGFALLGSGFGILGAGLAFRWVDRRRVHRRPPEPPSAPEPVPAQERDAP